MLLEETYKIQPQIDKEKEKKKAAINGINIIEQQHPNLKEILRDKENKVIFANIYSYGKHISSIRERAEGKLNMALAAHNNFTNIIQKVASQTKINILNLIAIQTSDNQGHHYNNPVWINLYDKMIMIKTILNDCLNNEVKEQNRNVGFALDDIDSNISYCQNILHNALSHHLIIRWNENCRDNDDKETIATNRDVNVRGDTFTAYPWRQKTPSNYKGVQRNANIIALTPGDQLGRPDNRPKISDCLIGFSGGNIIAVFASYVRTTYAHLWQSEWNIMLESPSDLDFKLYAPIWFHQHPEYIRHYGSAPSGFGLTRILFGKGEAIDLSIPCFGNESHSNLLAIISHSPPTWLKVVLEYIVILFGPGKDVTDKKYEKRLTRLNFLLNVCSSSALRYKLEFILKGEPNINKVVSEKDVNETDTNVEKTWNAFLGEANGHMEFYFSGSVTSDRICANLQEFTTAQSNSSPSVGSLSSVDSSQSSEPPADLKVKIAELHPNIHEVAINILASQFSELSSENISALITHTEKLNEELVAIAEIISKNPSTFDVYDEQWWKNDVFPKILKNAPGSKKAVKISYAIQDAIKRKINAFVRNKKYDNQHDEWSEGGLNNWLANIITNLEPEHQMTLEGYSTADFNKYIEDLLIRARETYIGKASATGTASQSAKSAKSTSATSARASATGEAGAGARGATGAKGTLGASATGTEITKPQVINAIDNLSKPGNKEMVLQYFRIKGVGVEAIAKRLSQTNGPALIKKHYLGGGSFKRKNKKTKKNKKLRKEKNKKTKKNKKSKKNKKRHSKKL